MKKRPWMWIGWAMWLTVSLHAETPDSAVATYKAFADAFIYGQLEEARTLAGSDRVRLILDRKEAAYRKAGGPRAIVETFFMIIDQRSLDQGQVKLHSAQVIQFREPADDPPVFHRQFTTLAPTPAGWRVVDFLDEEEECCK